MARQFGSFAVFVCAIAFAASPSVLAQVTGTVTGTVRDEQGGVLPGASVTLTSETRGTRSAVFVTNVSGAYVVPNVAADTYTLQVTLSGFRTAKRAGLAVSPGDRVVVPGLVMEVGGLTDTVDVRADAPVIQAESGERSFTIATDAVQNLPVASRNFTALAAFAPGMNGQNRLGGGGENNVTVDGTGLIATGANSVQLQLNVEAIAEVKVLTSAYQAEFGRSSGIQMAAVTKSGTNRFRGSVYDIERNSDWNENSWANKRNGVSLAVLKERDWGYSLGGPVGKPGGSNRVFFFFSQEWRPREAGGAVSRFRVPTELERLGDFSQSRDNNGAIYNLIRDTTTGLPCAAANTAGCFRDGGVVGKIPQNRLYEVGLNLLKMWPLPNDATGYAATNSYNYTNTTPIVKSHSRQEALRGDLQLSPELRVSARIVQEDATREPNRFGSRNLPGTLLNGYNDIVDTTPRMFQVSATVNYAVSNATFLEVSYGRFKNENNTTMISPLSNRNNVGLGAFPMLFPGANVVDPRFYSYRRLTKSGTALAPWFQDGRSLVLPSFSWGSRIVNTPVNMNGFGFLTENAVPDLSVSLTRVSGRHTMKAGYYWQGNWKPQTAGVGASTPYQGAVSFANDTNNPLDSTFGYANAALGVFTSYGQQSLFLEGAYRYNSHEFYVQDNWKVSPRLTLDYGARFVHQGPQYESYGLASNFVPGEWHAADAPVLFRPACAPGVAVPCTGQNLRAQNPITGTILGPGSSSAVGQLVPGVGTVTNGVFKAGTGLVPKTNYSWPAIAVAPRVGVAYDVRGDQKLVVRGGGGLFYDRPSGNAIFGQVNNPPESVAATVTNGLLTDLGAAQVLSAPSALTTYVLDSPLPASAQWNTGVQMALPWSSSIDVSYVGQHGYNLLTTVDINGPDFGAGYLSANQNPTVAASSTPGVTALPTNFFRLYAGFGAINMTLPFGYNWYHSLQASYQRRLRNGLSFGVNYTIGRAKGNDTSTPRILRNADGTIGLRDDNDQANYQLQGADRTHSVKANAIWDLPDLASNGPASTIIGAVVNDWQLSAVLTAGSGSPYTVNYSYQGGIGATVLTGTPTYNARIVIVGDPGKGCASDPVKQFNTAAFQGPQPNSLGLESGLNYMRGCPDRTVDLAVSRNVRLGGGRQVQIRLEMYNALNTVIFTGRNSTMNLASLATSTVATNLPFDAAGNVIPASTIPRSAGFGVVTNSNAGRSIQGQVRFSF